jgi:hypothetical protein
VNNLVKLFSAAKGAAKHLSVAEAKKENSDGESGNPGSQRIALEPVRENEVAV